jgi:hypothetical protein
LQFFVKDQRGFYFCWANPQLGLLGENGAHWINILVTTAFNIENIKIQWFDIYPKRAAAF